MKRSLSRLIFIFLAFLYLAPALPPGKTSVAIYPIKAAGATDKSVASALSALLSSELTPSTKLYVIEEGMLKTVMERQGANASDACDDTSCQVEIGKLVKAQKMITGDLVKLGSRYILSLKLVSIQSGTMEFSTRDECSCTEDQVDQLVASAALKIRAHYGETGIEVPPPPAPPPGSPISPSGGQAFLPVATTQGTGYLAIATTPDKADILLDAENKGKTPQTLKVPVGSHSLTLTKSGYSPSMQEIEIKPNETKNISLALLKQTGSLDISTTPAGAQIFLDDKYQGTSPKIVEGVLTGKHQVKAQLDNYQAVEQAVAVEFQQTTPVALALSGLPGKLLVLTTPEGAEVRIDGEKKGITTATGLSGQFSAGKHRVEVSKEGYEGASEEVEIAPNKTLSRNYSLKKYQGPVQGQEYRPGGKKGGPMVAVPAGEFWMGCNDRVDKECSDDEKPYHKVYLDAYYIDKFEVTQGDYDQCVSAGKCRDNKKYDGFTSARQPVVGVNWDQAKAYCEWAGKHLPTEAQWEKAARGTDGRKYPWGNQTASCGYAVMDDGGNGCGRGKTWEVGSKTAGASPYGALDLAGNAWEWVADWYDKGYYSSSPERNPTGASSGTSRVLRGGSWYYYAWGARASFRDLNAPSYQNNYSLGFRCVGD